MKVVQELPWACRRILRKPLSAFGIVLTLTLGITISVGMFSVLNGVVLSALPYPDADRIVVIYGQNLEQDVSRIGLRPVEAVEGLDDVPGFEHAAYFDMGSVTFTGSDTPLAILSPRVSEDYFAVFGVRPLLGRTLAPADVTENRPVAVLNHSAWMQLTGGDPEVLGQILLFEEGGFEVVGVLPPSFAHPFEGPLVYRPVYRWAEATPAYLNSRYLRAVGRIAPDASPALALEGLQSRLTAVNDAYGLESDGWHLLVTPLIDEIVGDARRMLLILFAVTLLVLSIACANAASLVTIRLEQRRTDIALRRALGASNRSLVRDVASELLLLAVCAALAGVLLAHLWVDALKLLAADNLPRANRIAIDTPTLLFATVAGAASVAISGATPLRRALRADPQESLRRGHREIRGGRHIALLPAVGVALSTVALIAALALTTSLIQLREVDPGFRTDNIAGLGIFRQTSPDDMARIVDGILDEVRAVPGVMNAVAVSGPPLSSVGIFTPELLPQHETMEPMPATLRRASAGYHDLLDIRLLRGRDIGQQDAAGTPDVIVINETLARQVFGGADPVGLTLTLSLSGERIPFEIVGVAADSRQGALRSPIGPEVVVPFDQHPWLNVTVLVESALDASPSWIRTLEEAVWRTDPNQPIYRSYALADDLDAQAQGERFFAAATGWFAILALLLGGAGVNAVVAAMQRRRTREIGLRLALGATPRQAATLMLHNALRITGTGLALGVLLAVPAMAWLQEELFGVAREAFLAFAGVTVIVLTAAGLAAAGWPAWRASRTAPLDVLRHE